MMFQDSEVEMQDRVGALERAVDDAVGHGLPPECAKMLRDIVFRTHVDVFRRALLGDPPARVEPMTVQLQPGARAVRAKPRASHNSLSPWVRSGSWLTVCPERIFSHHLNSFRKKPTL